VKGLKGKKVKINMQTADNLTGYKKLIVYQKAKDLVLKIYNITNSFPSSEAFGLTSQIRRAAVSVLANIVEGYAKESSAEFYRFLTISIGSLTELEVHFDLSNELTFIKKTTMKY
jgi:four helix bundle protein